MDSVDWPCHLFTWLEGGWSLRILHVTMVQNLARDGPSCARRIGIVGGRDEMAIYYEKPVEVLRLVHVSQYVEIFGQFCLKNA